MRSEGYSSWSVCLSVRLSVYDYSRTTGYEAAYERYQQLQCYKGIISTGLPRPGLARSAHRGRRGYVSKSSAALNPLTIAQLACER